MEKIIDRILSDLRFTPKLFNDFCSENNLDKSSRSAFKSSLESTIKELSSERDQIEKNLPPFTIKRDVIRLKNNFITDKREPVYGDIKVYPRGTDLEKVKRDNKRKDEIKKILFYLDEMLQRVNLYPEKENTPTKENENNVPGLIQFDEPIYSHLEQLKGNISRWKKNKSSDDTIKSNIKLQNERFYKKHMNDKEFTQLFKGGYKYFLQLIYPSLKPSFGFEWKLNAFVKTHENKYSPKKK